MKRKEIQQHFRRYVLQNFFLKAGSFVLALLLWLIVQIQGKIDQKVDLKIETSIFRNLPEKEIVKLFRKSDDISEVISVRMKGIPSAMAKIGQQASLSFELPENFSNWGQEVVFEIQNKNIQNVPFGVEILAINPTTVSVMLDYVLQKEVTLISNVTGKPAEGYELASVTLLPEKVTLTGPKSLVKDISEFTTEAINISNQNRNYTLKNVEIIRPALHYLTTVPDTIEVTVEIRVTYTTKTFKNQDLKLKLLDGTEVQFNPKKVNVTISGPLMLMKNINEDAFVVMLDVQELPPDKLRSVTPKVEFSPEYIGNLRSDDIEPQKIEVTVSKIIPK